MTQRLVLCGIAVLVLLAAIAVHGVVFADTTTTAKHNPSQGEAQPESSIGRYQIAAFEGDPQKGSGPGYYIIDTATGELWMEYENDKPSQISGPIANYGKTFPDE